MNRIEDSGLWRGFWNGIARLAVAVAGAPPSSPSVTANRTQPPQTLAGQSAQMMGADEFINKLKEAMAKPGGAVAGAIHVINLEKLRDRLKDRWPSVAERVVSIARTIIESRLEPRDVYGTFDGPVFLIVFSGLHAEAAKLKCALIAAEIERRLIGAVSERGEPDKHALLVRAAVATFGKQDGAGPIVVDKIAKEMMEQALKAAHSGMDSAGPMAVTGFEGERRPKDPLWSSLDWSPGIEPVWATLTPARSDGDHGWKPIPSEYETVELPEISFIYRPMWNVRRQALATFHCTPILNDPVHGPMFNQPVELDASASTRLDQLILDRVIADARSLRQQGRKAIISFPVTYSTLADIRRRSTLKDRFEAMGEVADMMIAEVVGIPPGAPGPRIYEIVAAVKPHVRAVNMRVRLETQDFSRLAGVRVFGVGVDMVATNVDEAKFIKLAERFAEAAALSGLGTYIHGLQSLSQVTAAICAGFQYVDGDPVASLTDGPEAVYRFSTLDIFAPLLGGSPPD